jgi:hypothetical protein
MAAARGAYRSLLRAQQGLFAGDGRALVAARAQTRAEFNKQRALADPARAATLVQDALDTAAFMRQSVVQTAMNDRGNFELTPDPALHFSASTLPEYVEDIDEPARLVAIKERRNNSSSGEGK